MAANINPAPSCLKADVWEHFGFKKKKESDNLDKIMAVCKLCHTNVKYSGNTTNLRTHLQRHHPDKVMLTEELKKLRPRRDPKQTMLDSDGGCSHKFPSTSPRSQKITESIAYFICQDLRPYSVVENIGFRRMVNAMEPRYPVPTRQHLTKVCVPRLYAQTKAHVKASLGKAERVALTCDGWTSRTTEAYVTITAHFINEEWELVMYVLQTRDMPESHTGHNLAEHLRKAEWEITEKDPVIVTDNASNMTIAAEEAAFTLHVKCYAHTLNLAAQRALLGRVRRIVNFFRRSTTANHMLKEKQRLLQLPEHKLMTDVVTRWNSAHDMLERFLEQQPAICAALLSSERLRISQCHQSCHFGVWVEEAQENGSADDEGMASEEETVDDGVRFKEGESSQGQHPPPRNPKPSCPLAALLGGERYGGGAQPKTNTQENQGQAADDPLQGGRSLGSERRSTGPGGRSTSMSIYSCHTLLKDHIDQIIFLNKNLKRM
ncbi:hypothetical protein JOQ06_026906 [Pogonophryne albipinna]|uniref:BED-type domain-containing protein n=1 Tax=Pogonophryne albipinna TaxID=1090488 RepID=A0AAD6BD78_9TELE|nr:hypothetical protein JOQ06_026906 [Pogonophryne albipinna]